MATTEPAAKSLTRAEIEQRFSAPGAYWKGAEFWTLNPWRDDSEIGSFSINSENGTWYDFSTGQGGSIIAPGARRIAGSLEEEIEKPYFQKKGTPGGVWYYRDLLGRVLFAVVRFDGPGGKKEILPFHRDDTGAWVLKLPEDVKNGKRPLFNLPDIGEQPKLPVLIVEGEKCASVTVRGYVVTTWPGGSSSVGRADWSTLKDRTVYIWPDNDEPGKQAAEAIKAFLPQARILNIKDKPKGWDLADAVTEGLDLVQFINEQLDRTPEPDRCFEKKADELDRHFFREPSHGLLADILKRDAGNRIIYVPLSPRTGEHWYRNTSVEFWAKMDGIKAFARKAGENAVTRAFEAEKADSGDVKKIYALAGSAYQKVRTRDFLAGGITLFSENVTITGVQWNCTPECLPLLDGILDYSGKTIVSRKARENEFFRDPLPYHVDEILKAPKPEKWLTFLSQIHPDRDNFAMARQCYALAMRGQATKLFQVWYNREGNAGKNTIIDALAAVLPGRVKPISSAVILKGGDSSERRFGAAEMEGALISYFDEVG